MSEPTAATHVFVGMFRPPWRTMFSTAVDADLRRRPWLNGDYDEPVYITIKEALAEMWLTAPKVIEKAADVEKKFCLRPGSLSGTGPGKESP